MTDEQRGPCGPDLTQGVSLADLPDRGKLVGHVGDETVLFGAVRFEWCDSWRAVRRLTPQTADCELEPLRQKR